MRLKLFAHQQKDPTSTALEFEPGERHGWIAPLERSLRAPHFHHQDTIALQMPSRPAQNHRYGVESFTPTRERHRGFMPVLCRQSLQLPRAHVGRIAHDDIVPSSPQAAEQVCANGGHAAGQSVPADVAAGDGESGCRDIGGIDSRAWKCVRARDGDATGAGPDVEHPLDPCRLDPRPESRDDQLGDRRTRHQDAFIDVKLESRKPHAPHQVRGWPAFLDASIDQAFEAPPFRHAHRSGVNERRLLVIETERVKEKCRGFIEWIVGAVPERKPRTSQPTCAQFQKRADGQRRSLTVPLPAIRRGPHGCVIISHMSPSRISIILIALVLAAVAGAWVARQSLRSPTPTELVTGTRISPPRELEAFSLLSHQGQPFQRDALAGHWTLMFFGFTNCPGVCPATLATLVDARKRLGELAPGELPAIVLVSIDPERDTPEKLASYVAQFDPSVVGVTGPTVAIDAFAASVGIAHQKIPMSDGDYTVDHSPYILLLDPEGRWAAVFSPPHTADRLAADYLRMLAHG